MPRKKHDAPATTSRAALRLREIGKTTSYRAIGQSIDCSGSLISFLAAGKALPSLTTAVALEKLYEIPPRDWLVASP